MLLSAECSSLSSCNPNTANQNMHAYGALLIVSRIGYGIEQGHALLSLSLYSILLVWLSSMENFLVMFLSGFCYGLDFELLFLKVIAFVFYFTYTLLELMVVLSHSEEMQHGISTKMSQSLLLYILAYTLK